MSKKRVYKISTELLVAYQNASIDNARQLHCESLLLFENNHYARSYFLAIASIEEAGKAYLAFQARGRNLDNESLHKKLKEIFESHSQKIGAAFIGWFTRVNETGVSAEEIIQLIVHLKRGREKSMYVDATADDRVTNPAEIVRPVAAQHACELAEKCIEYTADILNKSDPPTTTSFDDKLLCLKQEKVNEVFMNKDFYDYLIEQFKKGGDIGNISQYIVSYHDVYLCKNRKYGNTPE